jgi:hypothetical protein
LGAALCQVARPCSQGVKPDGYFSAKIEAFRT